MDLKSIGLGPHRFMRGVDHFVGLEWHVKLVTESSFTPHTHARMRTCICSQNVAENMNVCIAK